MGNTVGSLYLKVDFDEKKYYPGSLVSGKISLDVPLDAPVKGMRISVECIEKIELPMRTGFGRLSQGISQVVHTWTEDEVDIQGALNSKKKRCQCKKSRKKSISKEDSFPFGIRDNSKTAFKYYDKVEDHLTKFEDGYSISYPFQFQLPQRLPQNLFLQYGDVRAISELSMRVTPICSNNSFFGKYPTYSTYIPLELTGQSDFPVTPLHFQYLVNLKAENNGRCNHIVSGGDNSAQCYPVNVVPCGPNNVVSDGQSNTIPKHDTNNPFRRISLPMNESDIQPSSTPGELPNVSITPYHPIASLIQLPQVILKEESFFRGVVQDIDQIINDTESSRPELNTSSIDQELENQYPSTPQPIAPHDLIIEATSLIGSYREGVDVEVSFRISNKSRRQTGQMNLHLIRRLTVRLDPEQEEKVAKPEYGLHCVEEILSASISIKSLLPGRIACFDAKFPASLLDLGTSRGIIIDHQYFLRLIGNFTDATDNVYFPIPYISSALEDDEPTHPPSALHEKDAERQVSTMSTVRTPTGCLIDLVIERALPKATFAPGETFSDLAGTQVICTSDDGLIEMNEEEEREHAYGMMSSHGDDDYEDASQHYLNEH